MDGAHEGMQGFFGRAVVRRKTQVIDLGAYVAGRESREASQGSRACSAPHKDGCVHQECPRIASSQLYLNVQVPPEEEVFPW
eukprot:symbB.v1.2.015740.t3/scaffold1123.1/size136624/5